MSEDFAGKRDYSQPAPHERPDLTFGGKAVGLTFNPSVDALVLRLNQLYADIIDDLDFVRSTSPKPEVKRLASIAITEAQTAQMWAVKAVTWRG